MNWQTKGDYSVFLTLHIQGIIFILIVDSVIELKEDRQDTLEV